MIKQANYVISHMQISTATCTIHFCMPRAHIFQPRYLTAVRDKQNTGRCGAAPVHPKPCFHGNQICVSTKCTQKYFSGAKFFPSASLPSVFPPRSQHLQSAAVDSSVEAVDQVQRGPCVGVIFLKVSNPKRASVSLGFLPPPWGHIRLHSDLQTEPLGGAESAYSSRRGQWQPLNTRRCLVL